MTLAVDRTFDRPVTADRRGSAAGPRLSWASAQPFVPSVNPALEGPSPPRWRDAIAAYRREAVASDALAMLTVGGGLAAVLYGTGPGVAASTLAAGAGFVVLVALAGGYDARELGDGPAEYQALLRAGIWMAVALTLVSYVTNAEVPRLLVFGGAPVVVLAALVGRHAHRRSLHRRRTMGEAMMRTLVVGGAPDAARVVDDLSRAPHHGYDVTGVCLPSIDGERPAMRAPVVGAIADVAQVVADQGIDVVVVSDSAVGPEALRRLSWALDRAGAQLIVVPRIIEVVTPRLRMRPKAGLSLLEVEVGSPKHRRLAKAVIDRVAGLALLLAAAPIILAAALAVRWESPGAAFYRQTRLGVDGRPFTLWKLRSMYADADARRAALLASDEGAGVLFKIRNDPRITRVGRYLRRFSVDELPQLLNVVKGDMSLVGPRPPLAEEVARYADPVQRRLRVKPGLTGLWQVSGRSDLTWEESVRLDLRYVDNWSVAMDLTILWKTAQAVLRSSGAY